MGWTAFLLTYLLGGITFLPLVVISVLLHAHFTFPYRDNDDEQPSSSDNDIVQPGDDVDALKIAQSDENKARLMHHDSDVAAGYFAVCREYTPMGINAKPIERSTPVGSATVAAPSPSVYQTMYQSIFDRKPKPGPLDHKNGANQRPKKAGNVFFTRSFDAVDDDEQLEVRHVVSLAHHDISLYSGEEPTPEGELFIKRNAICLSRRPGKTEPGPEGRLSKPFFLFSENCSAKEDFYFALLRNQEQTFSTENKAPTPIHFDVKSIIALVQKLHSSEEHMQTRWLNALIGRIFLAVYKTKDIENMIREKLTKKISRVKRPSFLSNIAIRGIDTGESAPYITNPRLRDLTVEGECVVEADMKYTGNFRLEVEATARIDLGSRFKAREVNLVLAVVLRKLEGHVLFKIKPPPSDRIWFSFQHAPKMEMTIEPIVSSRQITYTVILRQIENRIKEVIAETLVLPFWDDTPFFRTEHKKWRGGIFHDDKVEATIDLETVAAQAGDLDEVDRLEDTRGIQEPDLYSPEKSYSMPVLHKKPSATGLFGRKFSNKNPSESTASLVSASSTSIEVKNDVKPDTKSESAVPRPVRSASFAKPPTATVETDASNSDIFKPSSSPPHESLAASAMATLSARSQSASPASAQTTTPNLAPFKPYITSKSPSHSSNSSREATDTEKDQNLTPQQRRNTASSTGSHETNEPKSPSLSAKSSVRSQAGSIAKGFFNRRDATLVSSSPGSPGTLSATDHQKRTALAAVSNVAASAKRWGLNALQRNNSEGGPTKGGLGGESESSLDLNQPMGRGRPLPPPGTPLPMPDRKTPTAPIPAPRRKPVAPPILGPHGEIEERKEHKDQKTGRRPVPPPPLPKRRKFQTDPPPADEDNMLVVAAPADSEPTTPLSESNGSSYVQPWVEDATDEPKDSGGSSNEDIVPPAVPPRPSSQEDLKPGSEAEADSAKPSCQSTAASAGRGDDDDDDEYSAWLENAEPEETGPAISA